MAKGFAERFYNSKRWKLCRKAYIEKRRLIDGGMCEVCHERPGHIVHHKVTLTPENINDPGVTLNHALLEYNCKDCHDQQEGHGVGFKNAPAICAFGQDGEVLGILPPYEKDRL